MKSKLISVEDAAKLIKNGDTVALVGFMQIGHAEAVDIAVEKRFLATGEPNNLTMVFGASPSRPGVNSGLNRWCKEGLIKRIVGGHLNLQKDLPALINANKIEAYNLPQGVILHLFRAIGGRQPGVVTPIGLRTFVDPRISGGKLNSRTTEEIVELVKLGGEEYLWYKPFSINVAIIRGTYADEKGNLTWNNEVAKLEHLAVAMATKASGGIVIAQCESMGKAGSLPAKDVFVPGMLVDYVCVAKNLDEHPQTSSDCFEPWLSGQVKIPLSAIEPMEINEKKVVCRRAAMELKPNTVINLGIGTPEYVGAVAAEEGLTEFLTSTVESGPIGGVAQSALRFGSCANPEAFLEHHAMFDFYNGGGIDLTVLGLAEVDANADLNVSKFGPRVAGAGGFINISQSSKIIVFVGTFTANGLKCKVGGGKLVIEQEGKTKKFIKKVEQITFSGQFAREKNLNVYFVTERAVFTIGEKGLTLVEIAPGIDLETQIMAQMEFRPEVSPDLKLMDERIFMDKPMGLFDEFMAKA